MLTRNDHKNYYCVEQKYTQKSAAFVQFNSLATRSNEASLRIVGYEQSVFLTLGIFRIVDDDHRHIISISWWCGGMVVSDDDGGGGNDYNIFNSIIVVTWLVL